MTPRKDYRHDLERAARQMILVRKIDVLARLILRTIMRNIPIKHAGIFLYDKKREEYIVTVSKGKRGVKVPVGFTKVKKDNPLIRYFIDWQLNGVFKQDFLLYDRVNYYLRIPTINRNDKLKQLLLDIKDELSLYQAKALIPGFFRNDLVGILFLGAKESRTGFRKEELGFLTVLASDVVMSIQNAWLFEDLSEQLAVNKNMFFSTVTAMATAIEAKDKYTIGHTARVVKYSMGIANQLVKDGIPGVDIKKFKENLRIAALLHDIGKIGVPEKILNKEGPLDPNERVLIERHPDVGADILSHIVEFKDIIQGVKYHHERYDGRGYPSKLAGEDIPLTAAIISVADTYDAMTSDRPYRRALSSREALIEIEKNSAKQFHPKVVMAFKKSFEIEVLPSIAEENIPAFSKDESISDENPPDGLPAAT
jgi:putative nucleotidyltransferase with HDIG domain